MFMSDKEKKKLNDLIALQHKALLDMDAIVQRAENKIARLEQFVTLLSQVNHTCAPMAFDNLIKNADHNITPEAIQETLYRVGK